MNLLLAPPLLALGIYGLLRARRDYLALRAEYPQVPGKADPMAVSWVDWLYSPTPDRSLLRRKRRLQWCAILGVAAIGAAARLVWDCF